MTNIAQVIAPTLAFKRRTNKILQESRKRPLRRRSGAAEGDALERARLLAAWNNSMGDLRADDKGRPVLSSPQNGLASRLKSLLVQKALEPTEFRLPTRENNPDRDWRDSCSRDF